MNVTVYSKTICPYCTQAKQYLEKKGIVYQEINLDDDNERQAFYDKYPGVRSVPQIFFGDTRIGGFLELMKAKLPIK